MCSLPFTYTEESELIETSVKLTGLDVARELQGNRALTLISAYAMYTSNVDVLLSVSSLSTSPERAGTNRWLLGQLSSHLKHHMSYTCNVRKHGIIRYCLSLCRSPHRELHILGYWAIGEFIKRKSVVLSRLLRHHKQTTGACQYQQLPQKHCKFLQ